MVNNKGEYILSAAIYFDDKIVHKCPPLNIKTGFVVTGRRHSDCHTTLEFFDKEGKYPVNKDGQGFITSKNRYLNRADAYWVAKNAGQLSPISIHDENPCLISEDLYWGNDTNEED